MTLIPTIYKHFKDTLISGKNKKKKKIEVLCVDTPENGLHVKRKTQKKKERERECVHLDLVAHYDFF